MLLLDHITNRRACHTAGSQLAVTAAALVCAGLLSVLIFPLIALGLLGRNEPGPAAVQDVAAPVPEPHLM